MTRWEGNGTYAFFWTDRWLGEIPLCNKFRRLFDFAEDKWVSVAAICDLGWGEGGEA